MKTTLTIATILLIAVVGCGEAEPEVAETTPAVANPAEVIEGEADTIDLGDAEVIEAAEADEMTGEAEETRPAAPAASRNQPAPETAPRNEPAAERSETATTPPSGPSGVTAEPAPAPVVKEEPPAEEKPASSGSSMKRPKTHTLDNEGVMHAPGLETPQKKCAVCHGKDLQGGKVGVGCFDCHDQNWE